MLCCAVLCCLLLCSSSDNLPDAAEVAEERAEEGRLGTVTVGFGHDAVLSVAGAVVDAGVWAFSLGKRRG